MSGGTGGLLMPRKLTCEKLLFGGGSLCRTEDGVIFTEGLLPGESAQCEPAGKKGGVPFYSVVSRESDSLDRREPFCQYYEICGGCNWQHLRYEAQLSAKREIFLDALSRIGKITVDTEIETVVAEEKGYRIRAQFKVSRDGKKIGFFKKGTNEIVEINSCPLLSDNLNTLLDNRTALLARCAGKKQIKVLDIGDEVLSMPAVHGLTQKVGTKRLGGNELPLKGDSFFQSNQFLTEALASWCDDEISGTNLLDLFGGVGLFTLFHGRKFNNALLVEIEKSMVKEARRCFAMNSLDTAEALAISAEKFFANPPKEKFDTVIVDPPRPGLTREVRLGIKKLAPKTLLYISCNPTTQARDVGYFVNDLGYEIERIALFDLYPNTHHMETGILLRK